MGINRNWNEFDWEKELKKDEQRIHGYFCELSTYLDLPGEEEFIMKKLMSKPELVPARQDDEVLSFESFYEDNYELLMNSEWRRNKNGIFTQLEQLGREWTLIFSTECSGRDFATGMNILCRFGKLLTRNIDFIELSSGEETPALKRAVLKRLYAETNLLMGVFNEFKLRRRSLLKLIDSFSLRLQHIREQIFDTINELK
ncbi:MAG: hypothetical protein L3J71_03710 [Victivallaceae bacterium]|nr:hypothetical protein [Victivallaceae bacterium]